MQQKLRDLLDSEGLKPSQFSEMLGVNPAAISHLLAGRNKPGYDFLQKILRRFPRISPDWLLLDSGPMYRDDASMPTSGTAEPANATELPMMGEAPDLFHAVSAASSPRVANETPAAEHLASLPLPSNRSGAQPLRVVICYDDGSFESFSLRK